MKLNLETEILEVLRALTQLQEQYLDLVTKEEDGAADVLQDYRTLCERMVEWGEQLDPEIRAGLFGNRVLVKLVGVRPASLLQPALSVLATLANFREKDLEPHKGKILLRLGERLTSSLSWALESLQGSEDSRIYTMSESRSIFEKSAKILQFLCDKDSNLTRHIIRKQEYIKESLQIFMNRFKNKTFRDLYENLESEEEYMRDEERKLIAVIKIQSTVRMWRQKKLWRKLRNGMIACQRLYRRRREISESNLTTTPEQSFKKELTRISLRKQGLEYKYRRLERIEPRRFGNFVESEQVQAASRIQRWWRRRKGEEDGGRKQEEERREKAVKIIQAGARRWLVLRRSAPVWSQLLAPKVISEERARQLQLEIDIWQQKTKLWVDREETTKLHVEAQNKYRNFLLTLGSRRLAEHRPDMWSTYHTLPLPLATAARVNHQRELEKTTWPLWRRKIQDILNY
ncbi:uncharacterized protein LOC111708219 isoform X2 [Eurytemora carolleeae]|uniref:uncharacterized protein LOC111708219 isoform X2 n=1 Tax=Eurytemora carolleeae TaxID=1294199 RepID=UPI000C77E151|nr:uncharacterized protein LOC111708219 isoform X2 [Eurytemora carolleeae]|eukprot:XP_023337311.1 uncharacterized protein LOC111708219 isoform X2 [Eurytemora affinis]